MNKLLLLPVIAATAGMSGVGFLGNDFFMNIAGFGTSHQDIPNPVLGTANVNLSFDQDPFTLVTSVIDCHINFVPRDVTKLYTVKCILSDQLGNFVRAAEASNFMAEADGVVHVTLFFSPIDIQEIDDVKVLIFEQM